MHAPAERRGRDRWADLGDRRAVSAWSWRRSRWPASGWEASAFAARWLRPWLARPGRRMAARLCRLHGTRRVAGDASRAAGIAAMSLLAGGALLWLRDDPVAGRANVLFLLLVVWAGDIGAYLVGRWIGGPRLAPGISPGKTWSGAVGGLVAASVVGLLAAGLLSDGAAGRAIPLAAVLGIVAQAGDLLESFVKRRLEVKDSGHLIPGHGGLFDRLDGVLAAAPVAALLALTLRTWSSSLAMTPAPRSVTVLGSTGSVGTQTVELLAAPARAVPGPRPGRRPQRQAAGRAGGGAEGRARGDRRSALATPSCAGPGRHRHRQRRGRGSGGGGRRAAGRLDHGGDHRRRRARGDPRRDQPGRLRGSGQQGGAGLRRRGHAARGARGRRHAAAGRFRAQRDLPGAGGRQPRRRREDRADRLGRAVPHRDARGDGQRYPGHGAASTRSGRWAPRSASIPPP